MKNESGTKRCKYCQTEIPKKAKICPNCQKKQGGKLKWLIIAFVAVIIIAAMTSGGDDEGSGSGTKTTDTDVESKVNEKNEKETAENNESDILTVGSSFEKNGLKITINEISTDFQDYNDKYGWNTPDDGMKYIMASFTFENNGKSDAYVSIYDFDCYADNTNCEQVYSLDDSDFINVNLSPGRNVSFKTYYTVPIDAQSIELEYETNMWTGEKAVITIQ